MDIIREMSWGSNYYPNFTLNTVHTVCDIICKAEEGRSVKLEMPRMLNCYQQSHPVNLHSVLRV